MKKNYFYIITFLLIANFVFSVMYGKKFFSFNKITNLILQHDVNNPDYIILTSIRIPRVLATYIVGAGLAVSACVLQSIFFNPLCESYTLGISSAAAIGVVLGILFNLSIGRFFMSIAGSVFALLTVYLMNLIFKKVISISFILSGIVLNFLFSSIIILLTIFFDPYRLHYILLWLLGGFYLIEPLYIYITSIIIFLCIVIIIFYSSQIDIIVLGSDKAISLGVNEIWLKNILIILVIIISSLCVSLSGVIAFVGIIIPNIIKSFTGLKHKSWIIYSALTSALFVSLSDNLAKNILYPIEIPISVFTGILGSVFFIFYLVKVQK